MSSIFQKSFAKINITLRVTNLREDGYHDICSLFWKIDLGETLEISPRKSGGDVVEIVGDEKIEIEGENIVEKALRVARNAGCKVPPLAVKIHKKIPPGMGLGAGSGNADAILNYVKENFGGAFMLDAVVGTAAREIGADVPFFLTDCDAAIVSGIGDKVEPIDCLRLDAVRLDAVKLDAVVKIPEISSPTKGAYKALDDFYGGKYPHDEKQAREEIFEIKNRLETNALVRLLPNDFAPLLLKNSVYENFFNEMEQQNALAWGITGSGAAAFALFPVRHNSCKICQIGK